MFVIEGADLVGKTTLARRMLKDEFFSQRGYIYTHFSRLPKRFDFFWGYIDRASKHIVQDRFHMSEIVYARIRKETPGMSTEKYWLIDGALRRLGCFTLIVIAPDELLRERYAAHADREMYNIDEIISANDYFKLIVENNTLGPYRVDYDAAIVLDKSGKIEDTFINEMVSHYDRRQSCLFACESSKPRAPLTY